MSDRTRYLELRCRACSWSELCGPEGVARWLTKAKKLKTKGPADLDVMYEVFRAAVPQLACPECGRVGLVVEEAADDDWPGGKPCGVCGKLIPEERLAAVPGTTLCAACQGAEERGLNTGEVEYCPRCGAPMELRLSRSGGITRYVMACAANPPCRL